MHWHDCPQAQFHRATQTANGLGQKKGECARTVLAGITQPPMAPYRHEHSYRSRITVSMPCPARSISSTRYRAPDIRQRMQRIHTSTSTHPSSVHEGRYQKRYLYLCITKCSVQNTAPMHNMSTCIHGGCFYPAGAPSRAFMPYLARHAFPERTSRPAHHDTAYLLRLPQHQQ